MDADVLHLNYEEFVLAPADHLSSILNFLGRESIGVESAVTKVSRSSVGKGRQQLGHEAVVRLERLGGPMLRKYGYA